MRSAAIRIRLSLRLGGVPVIDGAAQQVPAVGVIDSRVGLKAGLHDAGEAARNMEHVANLPKPDGFFDPTAPAGRALSAGERARPARAGGAGAGDGPPPFDPVASNRLGFANSDLAFSGNHVFVGNFHGFNTYDIERPKQAEARRLRGVSRRTGRRVGLRQPAVHVGGADARAHRLRHAGRADAGQRRAFPRRPHLRHQRPEQAEAGRRRADLPRLAHAHARDRSEGQGERLHLRLRHRRGPFGARSSPAAPARIPKDDPNTALFSIDVIKVPLARAEKAKIVNRPRIFADPKTGAIAGLWKGGDHGPGTQTTRVTNQCHDITVYPAIGLAAGACSGNGILLDISDPVHPVRLDEVADPNFAFWHSATFNNDGTKVLFTDEWGGGGRPRCRATDPPNWGADAIFTSSTAS